jgi:hypothetical protein
LQVAKEWHKIPSEWDALDDIDRLEMIALTDAENKMQQFEQEEAERNRPKI